jgi:molecular chaperone GrpE (heat shock protein)
MPQCCVCHKECTRGDFSKAQLKKSPDQRKCKNCLTAVSLLHESSSEYHHHQQPQNISVVAQPTEKERIDGQEKAPSTSSSGCCVEDALKDEIAKLQTQLREIEATHQTKILQLESKVSEAFQGMERAKRKIAHLETLAGEAVASLKTVQEQAAAEFDSLRKQLEQAQAERHSVLTFKT